MDKTPMWLDAIASRTIAECFCTQIFIISVWGIICKPEINSG